MPRSAALAAWVVAFLALCVYVQTLSPTVAWVNQGEDSGDLLVASTTLGIPHPTGYPLFVLLGRVLSLVPLGSVAFRINLVAAIAGAASVWFLARLVLESAAPRSGGAPREERPSSGDVAHAASGHGAILAATGAGLAYAFSRGPWSQSVLAEVYTLNAAFLGAILWALARAERGQSLRHLALAAYLLGLGLTNHLLLLAAVPALLLVAIRLSAHKSIGLPGILLLPLLLVWGATLDLYLPIRAVRGPEFSWGVPSTPDRFWWVVSGAQYAGHFFSRSLGDVVRHWVPGRWVLDFGWGLPALGLGLLGLAWTRRASALPIIAALLGAGALLSSYAIPDDVGYWMPLFYAVCALSGLGWLGLWSRAAAKPGARALVVAAALTPGVFGLIAHYHSVDASKDVRPWVWARRNLEAVEPNALIVSEYDGRTFALWFYKATEFRRSHPQLVVAYKYLLVWPWYQHHLARTYRTLRIPPYPGSMDAMLNRLIARNIRDRPVYLVRDDPALLPIFVTEPTGYGPDPLYRVHLREPR